jgi:predicted house-cleaning noncanonical NTP pyrophosphatase (MazG superfamily)
MEAEGGQRGEDSLLMGWKMVRDLHQQVFEGKISGQWRTAADPVSSLVKKLGEEYSELAEDRNPEELYDIADVVTELIRLLDPEGKAARKHRRKVLHMGLFLDHAEWHPDPGLDLRAAWGYTDSPDMKDGAGEPDDSQGAGR